MKRPPAHVPPPKEQVEAALAEGRFCSSLTYDEVLAALAARERDLTSEEEAFLSTIRTRVAATGFVATRALPGGVRKNRARLAILLGKRLVRFLPARVIDGERTEVIGVTPTPPEAQESAGSGPVEKEAPAGAKELQPVRPAAGGAPYEVKTEVEMEIKVNEKKKKDGMEKVQPRTDIRCYVCDDTGIDGVGDVCREPGCSAATDKGVVLPVQIKEDEGVEVVAAATVAPEKPKKVAKGRKAAPAPVEEPAPKKGKAKKAAEPEPTPEPSPKTVAKGKKAAPAAEPAPKAETTGKVEIRKPQRRVLEWLVTTGNSATRKEIAAGAKVDQAALTEYLGSTDDAKRLANDAKHFPSLVTLGLVVASAIEGADGRDATAYAATKAGRAYLKG